MSLSELGGPAHILLVEDDNIDREIIRRALNKAEIKNPVTFAADGVEGIEILKGDNGKEKIPQPCIILLDINMPRMNGFQFLQALRDDAHTRKNVVFMVTTSGRKEDKKLAYDLHAAGYVLKESISGLATMLSQYCRINQFPA